MAVVVAVVASVVCVVVDYAVGAVGAVGATDAVCVVVALMPLPPFILMSGLFGVVLQWVNCYYFLCRGRCDGACHFWRDSLVCHICVGANSAFQCNTLHAKNTKKQGHDSK